MKPLRVNVCASVPITASHVLVLMLLVSASHIHVCVPISANHVHVCVPISASHVHVCVPISANHVHVSVPISVNHVHVCVPTSANHVHVLFQCQPTTSMLCSNFSQPRPCSVPISANHVHALFQFQPIMSLFRCAPDHAHRPLFNWAHWFVGSSAYILGGQSFRPVIILS